MNYARCILLFQVIKTMTFTTTVGVKLSTEEKERLKQVSASLDRTPHWVIKQLIHTFITKAEQGATSDELLSFLSLADDTGTDLQNADISDTENNVQPFLGFAENILSQSVLRAAITAAYRRPEPETVPMLLEQARLPADMADASHKLAVSIAEKLRHQKSVGGKAGIVQGLLQEFSLSSQEGVALMCLAEALLRIPDKGTRDALIRDKISHGNWQPHLGHSSSIFVNAATWGLLLTGKLVSTHNEAGLMSSLSRIIGKSGEPMIRKGVDMAMRLMGEQFVTGETIADALANAIRHESKGFRYSYDMLGEAALTTADAERYFAAYQQAIHAIGQASHSRGIYEGPGISVKLSALHPRYSRAQYDRVITELYPRLYALTVLAKQYDIGINIDAEEADRLELSLDLLERLCFEITLAGWNGIGFVIQAYQKRCPFVIDYLIDLARRSRHRLMIRLVKGAYWDSEIKRAQLDGLEGYPVYTRKVYTDISYIACARKLLTAPEAIYPQFATHNAQTLSAIYHLAGQNYYSGQYEFQCLHGMGEPLYEQVVGKVADGKLNRPCRIYAPVGSHETLLAYLVRRLLENGANTSFVNRIADKSITVQQLVADPVSVVEQLASEEGQLGLSHPRIPLPSELYGTQRLNSAGIDLSNEHRLASLSGAVLSSASTQWQALPMLGCTADTGKSLAVLNPANLRDIVGTVQHASLNDAEHALQCAVNSGPIWQATPATERAGILVRAADLMQAEIQSLVGLLSREAGKTFANAIAEVREAVDFLRYYAAQAKHDLSNDLHRPLGPVVCISPWNFPLAIFTGQVAAALAAGNTVLAKPAEQTPLVAAQAVRILLEAGIPQGVLQLLPGPGVSIGAFLVADKRVKGVMFTGSTEVARTLQQNIAGRLDAHGKPVPLIAETGGLNTMIVDSSALAEQVVIDVMSSSFDSAGQRCSALRVLCLQEDIAEHIINMLKGAMTEVRPGNPASLATDIGPVIDRAAQKRIERHIQMMRDKGRDIYQIAPVNTEECQSGTFVVPTLIELENFTELQQEIFGPVLHVVRYKRQQLNQLMEQIRASGYGLTLGVHTRIDETIAQVIDKAHVGNIYVNRNIVGAVVGVQPFGGEGLSGTGPKAGGPLYLYRLLSTRTADDVLRTLTRTSVGDVQPVQQKHPLEALQNWAITKQRPALAELCQQFAAESLSGTTHILPGPTGERNSYMLLPKESVLCLAEQETDLLHQLAAVLAAGGCVIWQESTLCEALYTDLSADVQSRISLVADWHKKEVIFDAVLYHGDSDQLRTVCQQIAKRSGPVISVTGLSQDDTSIALERLMTERAVSINTAAAGGNASLMTIG